MKLDLEIHASDLEDNFSLNLEAGDMDDDDMVFVLAYIIHAFEIIDRDGIAGAAHMAGRAVTIADIMREHEDKIIEERIKN